MSYVALSEALVDNQRQVLGDKAEDVARRIDGIEFEDGEIVQVTGEPAVAELAQAYEDRMGQAALSSMRIAANEFEGWVDLPDVLEM